jgi:hypothetical protein
MGIFPEALEEPGVLALSVKFGRVRTLLDLPDTPPELKAEDEFPSHINPGSSSRQRF